MNSKILLVAVVLIVVFGAITFLGNKKNDPTLSTQKVESEITITPSQTKQQDTIVALTDAGFVPKDIIIKVGQKVVWLNKSGKNATVSSNEHPTHRLYPFLNLGEFADGSSVQAVFDKAGKYSYHDHLNSSSIGSVAVE